MKEALLEDFQILKGKKLTLKYDLPITLEMEFGHATVVSNVHFSRIMLSPGITVTIEEIVKPSEIYSDIYAYLNVEGISLTTKTGYDDNLEEVYARFKCDAEILESHGYLETEKSM